MRIAKSRISKEKETRFLWKGFYFITDHVLSQNGNVRDVQLALDSGVRVIQFREKNRKQNEYESELLAIQSLCRSYSALMIVNDDPKLAMEIDADGVHLGQEDMSVLEARNQMGPNKIIGLSTSSLSQSVIAEPYINYIAVGSIFPTQTKKKNIPPLGVVPLLDFRKHLSVPLVAIGGIELSNVLSVLDTGVDMICAISASLKNGQVKENIQFFLSLFPE